MAQLVQLAQLAQLALEGKLTLHWKAKLGCSVPKMNCASPQLPLTKLAAASARYISTFLQQPKLWIISAYIDLCILYIVVVSTHLASFGLTPRSLDPHHWKTFGPPRRPGHGLGKPQRYGIRRYKSNYQITIHRQTLRSPGHLIPSKAVE